MLTRRLSYFACVLALAACGSDGSGGGCAAAVEDSDDAAPLATLTEGEEEESSEGSSSTGAPDDPCPMFVGCAETCAQGDQDCREDCAELSGADLEFCTSQHCVELGDQCGDRVPGACDQWVDFCNEPEGTTGEESSSDSSSTGEAPSECDAYLMCVAACGPDDCPCARIYGDTIDPAACDAEHCEDLERECATDPDACAELVKKCAPDGGTSSGTGGESGGTTETSA